MYIIQKLGAFFIYKEQERETDTETERGRERERESAREREGGQKEIKGKDYITDEKLTEINKTVHDKPYDLNIIDWLGALIRKDWTSKKTNKFWCSAFIGYVLNRLNFIDDSVDWSTLRPCDFSSSKNYLKFKNDCMYGTDIDLKL